MLKISILLLLVLYCGVPVRNAIGDDVHPNVLFIAIDDLNDWIGCLDGHPQALTPNIDRLADRGVLFTNAHCAAPACSPSRTSLFTGQMPQNTGVWANGTPSLNKIRPDAFLLPHSFSKVGYRTVGAGKLGPSKDCWQEYFGPEQRWSPLERKAVDYTPEELPSKGTDNPRHAVKIHGADYVLPLNRMPSDRTPNEAKGESFDWGPFDAPDTAFGDTLITDWAIEQLNAPARSPLFLGVGYYRPHQPLWAPARFFERFRSTPGVLPQVLVDDLSDLSTEGRKWALTPITSGAHSTVVAYNQWRPAVEAYLACVAYIDHEIGRLLDALDRSQFAGNTLVVLWSDHGWHLGEKQHWGKWTGWERSTRVPLIIAPPKAANFANAGAECNVPVNLIDLYPTLIELCNVQGPTHSLDGQSLAPCLGNPLGNSEERSSLTMFEEGNSSLRTERWRFIQYQSGEEELYDLENDPNEWTNLIASDEHVSIKTAMAAKLRARLDFLAKQSKSDR